MLRSAYLACICLCACVIDTVMNDEVTRFAFQRESSRWSESCLCACERTAAEAKATGSEHYITTVITWKSLLLCPVIFYLDTQGSRDAEVRGKENIYMVPQWKWTFNARGASLAFTQAHFHLLQRAEAIRTSARWDNLDTPVQIRFDAALRLQSCLLTVEFTEFSSLGLYHLALCEVQDTRGYYAVLSGSSSVSSASVS